MTARRGPRRQPGFTLIEVLVAVAVLATAMGAIMSAMTRYTANAVHLQERSMALFVAHNRLTEILLEPQWPSVGKSDGDEELAGNDWRWDVQVLETQDPALRRVDIQVRRKEGDNDLATLSAFIADPNASVGLGGGS